MYHIKGFRINVLYKFRLYLLTYILVLVVIPVAVAINVKYAFYVFYVKTKYAYFNVFYLENMLAIKKVWMGKQFQGEALYIVLTTNLCLDFLVCGQLGDPEHINTVSTYFKKCFSLPTILHMAIL